MNTLPGIELAWTWYEETFKPGAGHIDRDLILDTNNELITGPVTPDRLWETRIECVAYHDRDYQQGALLKIVTCHRPDGAHIEMVDCLAVLSRPDRQRRVLDAEWYQHPRVFFDAGGDWMHGANRWFVDWLYDRLDALSDDLERDTPTETRSRWAAHRNDIRVRDRAEAAAFGFHFETPGPHER